MRRVAELLERSNVIDRSRLRATIDLAWPRVVTGFARMSQQTADLAMVGLAVGPTAIAGLAFAYAWWQIGNKISLGLSGGSISLVSQYYGADRSDLADRVINQSYFLASAIALPLVVAYTYFAVDLIGLLGADPESIRHGSVYLATLAPAILFEFYTKIASRVFAGIGDTFTPMVVRAGGALLNIVLNVVLIFGLGMGVVGAAIGTVVATVAVSVVFFVALLRRSYPILEPIPVGFALSNPGVDLDLLGPLVRISTPLVLQNLSRAVVTFPLLAIAAVFGPVTVAAFEIGRRIRDLINSLSWGFNIASSSLVGRHLGAAEEDVAASYGSEILRLSLVAYLALAVVVLVMAPWIARLFTADPATLAATIPFVRVGALASIALGLDNAATGALRGAGDTRWPFYGALIGLYLFALPVAYLGAATRIGIDALYLALLVETTVPAIVVTYRYRTGAWREISRSIREGS